MKIVICAWNGEDLFSGSSVFDDPESEPEPARQTETEPPTSGVFPMRLWDEADEHDEDATVARATASGIFPRNATHDEATMPDSIEDIDAMWDELGERACA
jgi:hypothetical protein